ncbi:Rieske (2Fe-2S) protein [Rhodococcus sp. CX]|uniref:QcrA and Rieske domain-containing protein n=1 Tax=Rhodococcus sp. CX TaxID=2789880 RepID=UPI0018CF203E|nr:Rieske (2Fe-2S) protein [Rhodococcus sp. CX]MBH0119481.1 Rieske (2Fe-2S) protein [Rhodococcus sp. CX]
MDPEKLPEHLLEQFPVNRRTVLIGVGVVAAAATAACGNSNTGSTGAATTTPNQANRTPAAQIGPLIAVGDIPVGGGVVFPSQEVVVTKPGDSQVLAFSAVCTHQGCTVADVSGGTINCPCHGSKYNLDGTVAHGPATRSLPGKTTEIRDGQVYVS